MNPTMQMLMSYGGSALTYATWNPSDKGGSVVLTGGNLTATYNASNQSVRANVGKSTGKWYWEVSSVALQQSIGLGNISGSTTTWTGATSNSISYDSDGNIYFNGSSIASVATYTNGAVIGIAMDMVNGQVTFYKNGAVQGVYTHGITGTLYPMASGYTAGAVLTANFGATTFAQSVPGGYNAGVYT